MSTPFYRVLEGTLGQVNVGAGLAAAAIIPLIAELDLAISFVGGLKLEFSASLQAAVNFNINFTNPLLALAAAIQASIGVIAALQAALAIGIPPLSISISASVAFAAAISVKIGLLNLFIDVALGIVGVGVSFLAQIQAAISAGPVALYTWAGVPMSIGPHSLQGDLSIYNFAGDGFPPASTVYGVMLLTAAPSAHVGMQFLFAI